MCRCDDAMTPSNISEFSKPYYLLINGGLYSDLLQIRIL
ncbi:hypothetical protein CPter291_1819 [Collimonas pratensis]|uniref:Uncharacterized protein n=1 Tax=Collimonas pratensis TaxID=279113 RepID=A0ABM5Z595_9BURK|nr:hypothetical protein CPter291_1819 [Collimonas pratensis]